MAEGAFLCIFCLPISKNRHGCLFPPFLLTPSEVTTLAGPALTLHYYRTSQCCDGTLLIKLLAVGLTCHTTTRKTLFRCHWLFPSGNLTSDVNSRGLGNIHFGAPAQTHTSFPICEMLHLHWAQLLISTHWPFLPQKQGTEQPFHAFLIHAAFCSWTYCGNVSFP